MNELPPAILTLLQDAIWQSGCILILAIVISFVWSRRAARAHLVLALALAAILVTPLLSNAARTTGWGWLPSATNDIATQIATRDPADGELVAPPITFPPGAGTAAIDDFASESTASTPNASGSSPERVSPEPMPTMASHGVSPLLIAAILWPGLSLAVLLLMIFQIRKDIRLVRTASAPPDCGLQSIAKQAAERLGLRVEPALRITAKISTPMVWCYAARPVILLPECMLDDARREDLPAIFTHELAHWLRRDHLTMLLGAFALVALPWNPLVWWARRRLEMLAERACDDWVIDTGHEPSRYA